MEKLVTLKELIKKNILYNVYTENFAPFIDLGPNEICLGNCGGGCESDCKIGCPSGCSTKKQWGK